MNNAYAKYQQDQSEKAEHETHLKHVRDERGRMMLEQEYVDFIHAHLGDDPKKAALQGEANPATQLLKRFFPHKSRPA